MPSSAASASSRFSASDFFAQCCPQDLRAAVVKQQVPPREQIATGVGNATITESVKNPLAYLRATPLHHLPLRPAKRT